MVGMATSQGRLHGPSHLRNEVNQEATGDGSYIQVPFGDFHATETQLDDDVPFSPSTQAVLLKNHVSKSQLDLRPTQPFRLSKPTTQAEQVASLQFTFAPAHRAKKDVTPPGEVLGQAAVKPALELFDEHAANGKHSSSNFLRSHHVTNCIY